MVGGGSELLFSTVVGENALAVRYAPVEVLMVKSADEARLAISVLNMTSEPESYVVDLVGFPHEGQANLYQQVAADPCTEYWCNRNDDPRQCLDVQMNLSTVDVDGEYIQYVYPAYSLTVVEIPRKGTDLFSTYPFPF